MESEDKTEQLRNEFYRRYEMWRAACPGVVEMAELAALNPDLPRSNFVENKAQEVFLFFLYGMELSCRDCRASIDLSLPEIKYEPELDFAGQDEGVISVGRYYMEQTLIHQHDVLIDQLVKGVNPRLRIRNDYRGITHDLIVEMIMAGAHEFSHLVIDSLATGDNALLAKLEYKFHRDYFKHLNEGREIPNYIEAMFSNLLQGETIQAIYDSCVMELMAVNWSRKVLKNHMPWETEKIETLETRRTEAYTIRRRMRRRDKKIICEL